jgi:hypothetical protein
LSTFFIDLYDCKYKTGIYLSTTSIDFFLKNLDDDPYAPENNQNPKQHGGRFPGQLTRQLCCKWGCHKASEYQSENRLPVAYPNQLKKGQRTGESDEKFGKAYRAYSIPVAPAAIDQGGGNNGSPSSPAKGIKKSSYCCKQAVSLELVDDGCCAEGIVYELES